MDPGAIESSGCRDWKVQEAHEPLRPPYPQKPARKRHAPQPEPQDAMSERELEITPPPSAGTTFCVSYAWDDQSKAVVDRLCEAAQQQGIIILRDTTRLGLGESIIRFMKKLGAGDRVFVILSDKYLKSPNCMYELLEVWRNCKEELEAFRRRIRVFCLPDAKIFSVLERALRAKHWKEQFMEQDKLLREHGPTLLGDADFKRHRMTQDFAHHVGDMLALIADTLQPTAFEELVEYGFCDEPPSAPP